MIYALVHPDTLEIRYVGKTEHARRRLAQHICNVKKGVRLPVYDWWRSLDHAPSMLRIADGGAEEERTWIAKLRQEGARLLNMTDGGDGTPGLPCSLALREKRRQNRLGKKASPETRAKLHITNSRVISLEARAKMRAAKIGKPLSLEHRTKLAAVRTGKPKPLTLVGRERVSASNRSRVWTPEMRARMSATKRGRNGA